LYRRLTDTHYQVISRSEERRGEERREEVRRGEERRGIERRGEEGSPGEPRAQAGGPESKGVHKFRTSLLLSAVLSAIARKAACRVGAQGTHEARWMGIQYD
jgi:hypothetical protein